MAGFFRTMGLDPHLGLNLDLNHEVGLTEVARTKLKDLLNWIVQFESQLIDVFSQTLGQFSSTLNKSAPAEILRELRPLVRGNEKQLTCYKYCYAAALVSSRGQKELFAVLNQVKEQLSIDPLEAVCVHDAVLSECTVLPVRSWEIDETDKMSVVALCCQLLRLDGMTHVYETEALRFVTIGLRVGAVAPSMLMSRMGAEPSVLFSGLSQRAKPWLLLHLLRIASADGSMRPKEKEFVHNLISLKMIDGESMSFVHKAFVLEKGLSFTKP